MEEISLKIIDQGLWWSFMNVAIQGSTGELPLVLIQPKLHKTVSQTNKQKKDE